MNKDRIAKIDYTIVGGPSHGMRIPSSNGYRPVTTIPTPNIPFYGGPIEHVPLRFVVGDDESVITVFSPPGLSEAVVQEFLNEGHSDELMRKFNPWRGHFVD
jgi:hypothetical protein